MCLYLCVRVYVCAYTGVCVKDLKQALVIPTILNSVNGVSAQIVGDLGRHTEASFLRQWEVTDT